MAVFIGRTEQAVGQVWPEGCSLLTPVLKARLYYNCTSSTLRENQLNTQNYSVVPPVTSARNTESVSVSDIITKLEGK